MENVNIEIKGIRRYIVCNGVIIGELTPATEGVGVWIDSQEISMSFNARSVEDAKDKIEVILALFTDKRDKGWIKVVQ